VPKARPAPRPAPETAASPLRKWLTPARRERLRQYALLTRQDKPVGWLLLLWPTWWGLWLAAEGTPPLGTLAIFTLGVIVMRSAGCVVNDYADRWLDARVERTRARPLVAGAVSAKEALLLFLVLVCVAFGLVLLTNRITVYLSFAALALAIVYPFLKRHTYVPQLWLGAAFGMSIPMAFSAVTGEWPGALAWLAFTANIVWATAYDTFYAMVDRDDDIRAGARSTAILFGDLDLTAIAILEATFLAAMALVGQRAGLGVWYFGALGVAALFSAWLVWRARSRSRETAFASFKASHLAGLALWLGIALDYALRAPAAG
jgi:4-hydroxybenzoate polyprenyltransferase